MLGLGQSDELGCKVFQLSLLRVDRDESWRGRWQQRDQREEIKLLLLFLMILQLLLLLCQLLLLLLLLLAVMPACCRGGR